MYNIWIDGGTKPYPSICICPEDHDVIHIKCAQNDTNNMLEYRALIEALKFVRRTFSEQYFIQINSDSRLLVNQFNGTYKVNKPHLRWLRTQAKHEMFDCLKEVKHEFRIMWIPRDLNKAGIYLDSLK